MQERVKLLVSLFVCALLIVPSCFAQSPVNFPPSQRELGYYDHGTGFFTPLRPAQDVEAPAVAPTTGEFVFNITITLKSGIPKNGKVTCNAHASVSDTSGFSSEEGGSAFATGTVPTMSCAIRIPYSWLLSSPGTDSVGLNYSISVLLGVELTATNGTATTVVQGSSRNTGQSLPLIKVPANGTTTTETISVTL